MSCCFTTLSVYAFSSFNAVDGRFCFSRSSSSYKGVYVYTLRLAGKKNTSTNNFFLYTVYVLNFLLFFISNHSARCMTESFFKKLIKFWCGLFLWQSGSKEVFISRWYQPSCDLSSFLTNSHKDHLSYWKRASLRSGFFSTRSGKPDWIFPIWQLQPGKLDYSIFVRDFVRDFVT